MPPWRRLEINFYVEPASDRTQCGDNNPAFVDARLEKAKNRRDDTVDVKVLVQ